MIVAITAITPTTVAVIPNTTARVSFVDNIDAVSVR